MYNEHTVAVVVPAYNESGFVGEVIETLPDFVDRVYAIDDRSTDETWAEITATAATVNSAAATGETASTEERSAVDATSTDGGAAFDRRVVPIRHETNRGVGGAIKTGYLRAREDEVDVTAVMGGDGQMDPDYLERIIRPITTGEAEYTKGNRLLNREDHAEMPRFRLVGNRILTLLTKIASGYWRIGDPQMGYTAISLDALRETDIENMYEFYGYCNDLLVRLNVAGHRVADVPSPLNYGDEHSDINYLTYIPRVSLMLLRTFLWRLWSGRRTARGMATLVLYVGGAAGTLGGLVTGLADDDGSTASALGGIFVLCVAMVFDGLFSWPQNSRVEPEE
ncbi:glycosyltransferase family 2 protein [Halohasta salina]|uniref:glycosyltransferase family 2 protein n=1 Tax=Halohasta salina TaxID=2961621 RepID=UPI0020A25AA4|nr:glycosyltransferase family 2 protein [Halohasta salina]